MNIYHNRLLFSLIFIATACMAGPPGFAQEAKWKFTAGESLGYELSQQTNMNVEAGDAGTFETTAKQTLDVLWQIDSVADDGTGKGTQKIERIRVEITMPGGLELNYDSESDEAASGIAAMLTPMYEALLESEVPIAVAPDGQLKEFNPPQELKDRLTSVPATRPMSDLVAGTGLRRIAELIAIEIPAEGTGNNGGEGRELVVENRVLGTTRGELTWTHAAGDAQSDSMLLLEPEITLTIQPATAGDDDNSSQPEPLESPEITQQSIDGQAKFDRQAGRLAESTLELNFQIVGEITGSKVTSDVQQTVQVRQTSP